MSNHKWQIVILRQPKKTLGKLPKNLFQRLWTAIRDLAENPRPPGCKKLVGHENLYRIRVGEWRITYAIENDQLIVLVLEVSPRGSAYRNL